MGLKVGRGVGIRWLELIGGVRVGMVLIQGMVGRVEGVGRDVGGVVRH